MPCIPPYIQIFYDNVVVYNYQATILDAKLEPVTDISTTHKNKNALFTLDTGPSGSNAKISFTLTNKGKTQLQIYNVKGELLSTLVDSYKQAGKHTVNWDIKRFGAGVYYIKLSAGSNTIIRKAVIAR